MALLDDWLLQLLFGMGGGQSRQRPPIMTRGNMRGVVAGLMPSLMPQFLQGMNINFVTPSTVYDSMFHFTPETGDDWYAQGYHMCKHTELPTAHEGHEWVVFDPDTVSQQEAWKITEAMTEQSAENSVKTVTLGGQEE